MGFKQLFPNQDIDFNNPNSVHIYTDGSCINNGKPDAVGGWAYIIKYPDRTEPNSGNARCTTNNRMEMTAVLEALKVADPTKVTTVYSDSQYVIHTLNGIYKIGKNPDLWTLLITQVRRFKHIQFVWVKGHADNEYNNLVDQMASDMANRLL